MTKEQEATGQLIEALNAFIAQWTDAVPDPATRASSISALHSIRHGLIHVGVGIGKMRAPLGLSEGQRECIAFLLDLAEDVDCETMLESLRLDEARRVIAPLVKEAPAPSVYLKDLKPALSRIYNILQSVAKTVDLADTFASTQFANDMALLRRLHEEAPNASQLTLVFAPEGE